MAKKYRSFRGISRKGLGSKESSVPKGKPITKPVTKVNNPTNSTNKLGLKTNTRIIPEEKIISRIEDKLDIVSKLDEGITDSETVSYTHLTLPTILLV